jgi:hypothetical protein
LHQLRDERRVVDRRNFGGLFVTSRYALAFAYCCVTIGPAFADPPKIVRSNLVKEPAYRTKAPKYALLAFGPQGKDQVWLVLDGDTLYVDRNGNGDLTEAGERVAAERNSGRVSVEAGGRFDAGDLTVGGRTHRGLNVRVIPLKAYADDWPEPHAKAALAKNPSGVVAAFSLDVDVPGMKGGGEGGRLRFLANGSDLNGMLLFADTPAEAPVVHLGGPLEVTFYGRRPTLRVGRKRDLILVVGTPGIGPGTFAMLQYVDTIPEDAKPVAELSLPARKSGDPSIKLKLTLEDRC